MTALVTFVTRRPVVTAAILIGIPLLALLAWAYHDGIQTLFGAPYDRRVNGAAGVCDWDWVRIRGTESWTKLYVCANEQERLAAAANVDTNDWILGVAMAIFTPVIIVIVIRWRAVSDWFFSTPEDDTVVIVSDNN